MDVQHKKQIFVMILCFILGGFSIMLYLFEAYDAFWRVENIPFGMNNTTMEFRNINNFNNSYLNRTGSGSEFLRNPIGFVTSPTSFVNLISGIILLLGGLSIWSLTRERELKSTKEKLTSLLLLPEERSIIDELKKNKGSMTQSQIVKNTGMSKVKAHRVVNRLAAKGIIKKYPYGLTNKIVLEKEL